MSNFYELLDNQSLAINKEEELIESIFKQYENVLISSIIRSFGLDFIITDRYGGDVDTIKNVKKIDSNEAMIYKNINNKAHYDSLEKYDPSVYYSHKEYKAKNAEISRRKKEGKLYDAYTGEKIKRNETTHLDHIVAASEIHRDRGRVLSGISGVELSNRQENLAATNPKTNRMKSNNTMMKFLNKRGDEYTDHQKKTMLEIDEKARKQYDNKIAYVYYTGSRFRNDLMLAAGKVGLQMGTRQALGFIFAEIWFATKQELESLDDRFDFAKMLEAIGNGIEKGYVNAKRKHKEIFEEFIDGAMAGALASLTTTLANIFFSTSKNAAKILREAYISSIEATKILFLNPEGLPFGETVRAALKVMALGSSVIVGSLTSTAVSNAPIGKFPLVGEIVTDFSGIFVTGIMTCSLIYFIDRNEKINLLIEGLDEFAFLNDIARHYEDQAEYFEKYASELMKIDIEKLIKETEEYSDLVRKISVSNDLNYMNLELKDFFVQKQINLPWEDEFDSFMNDKDSNLVFK